MGLDRRLIELTRGTRRWIAATVALGWLIVALNVAQTVLIGRAIGDALEGQNGLGWLLVAFACLMPIRATLNWVARLTAHRAAAQTKLSLRDRLFVLLGETQVYPMSGFLSFFQLIILHSSGCLSTEQRFCTVENV